jgi:hypothetical protein
VALEVFLVVALEVFLVVALVVSLPLVHNLSRRAAPLVSR